MGTDACFLKKLSGKSDMRLERRHKEGVVSGVACHFDCQAGYAQWTTSWPEAKRAWCCEHGVRSTCSNSRNQSEQANAPSTPKSTHHGIEKGTANGRGEQDDSIDARIKR